jgi:hypothetical protein
VKIIPSKPAQLRWHNGTLTTNSGRVLAEDITLDDALREYVGETITVRL